MKMAKRTAWLATPPGTEGKCCQVCPLAQTSSHTRWPERDCFHERYLGFAVHLDSTAALRALPNSSPAAFYFYRAQNSSTLPCGVEKGTTNAQREAPLLILQLMSQQNATQFLYVSTLVLHQKGISHTGCLATGFVSLPLPHTSPASACWPGLLLALPRWRAKQGSFRRHICLTCHIHLYSTITRLLRVQLWKAKAWGMTRVGVGGALKVMTTPDDSAG